MVKAPCPESATPITVPSGVEIAIDGSNITVKGSKGELSRELPGGVTANLDEQTLTGARPDDSKGHVPRPEPFTRPDRRRERGLKELQIQVLVTARPRAPTPRAGPRFQPFGENRGPGGRRV